MLYLKIFLFCLFYLYIMCICNVYNDKDFYPPPPWSKYPPYFIFCNLERICLCNREIIFAALIRHNSKINMTKNHGEIVIFLKE